MDFKEITKIVELMNEHGLSEFELEQDGEKLHLKKGASADDIAEAIARSVPAAPALVAAPAAAAPGIAAQPAAKADGEAADEPAPTGPTINSPMVGTFYSSPAPGEDSFIKVGDSVDEDTVVCIIEAMKVMNEIKAEKSGTIKKVLIDEATPVQYGEPLFEIG